MVELNNLEIQKLPQVLKKETLMEGYWYLIDDAETNCIKLHNAGIRYSVDVFGLAADNAKMEEIVNQTGVSKNYILSLGSLLIHHSFKPLSLKKVEQIDLKYVEPLALKGIKNTRDFLLAVKTKNDRAKLSSEINIYPERLERFAGIVDLMRKPGIKSTKAKLFTSFGIRSLKELGQQEPEVFRAQLAEFILRTGIVKAIPTPKEVMSDVSWARIYPEIIEY